MMPLSHDRESIFYREMAIEHAVSGHEFRSNAKVILH